MNGHLNHDSVQDQVTLELSAEERSFIARYIDWAKNPDHVNPHELSPAGVLRELLSNALTDFARSDEYAEHLEPVCFCNELNCAHIEQSND
jgi:hypothetical protein